MKKFISLLVLIVIIAWIWFWFNNRQTKVIDDQVTSPASNQVTAPDSLNFAQPASNTVTPAPAVDTADWKTYRNEQLGLEFKYPSQFYYFEDRVSAKKDPKNGMYGSIDIGVPSVVNGFWTIEVGDETFAQRVYSVPETSGDPSPLRKFRSGDYYILVRSGGAESELFNKFISTFKFTK